MVSRRSLLAAGVCSFAAPFINRGQFSLFAKSSGGGGSYSDVTIDIIRSSNVIDMMGLLTLNYPKVIGWAKNPATFTEADFQRLMESGTTVFHPAVGFTRGDVYTDSFRDITAWNLFLAAHADKFVRIVSVHDLVKAKALGKIGVVVGLQNSSHFRTVNDVDKFYGLGQRVSQLTYDDNAMGGGCSGFRNTGMTKYGGEVVARMNQLGMAVDISHCSDRTTLDTIDASTKPVLVTHSNCRHLVANSSRCKTDEAIRRMAAKGGVMGVTMVRSFVRPSGPTTVENVLDHIDHIVRIAGVEHAGLGTDVDLDGREVRKSPAAPRTSDLDGINYTRKIYDVTEGLVRRKYSRRDIELILGGNFKRALSAIWV
jgi:membrane dipeptidase